MNKDELLAVYDRQLRFGSTDPLSERQAIPEEAPHVVRHAPLDPHARWGWVIWSQLTEANADRVIAEQVAFFTGRGQNFEWKRYGHDGPADLDERLLRQGFVAEELESIMVLDLHDGLRDEDAALERNGDEHDVRRVTDSAGLAELVKLEDAVWNESHAWIADELLHELAVPGERLLIYLAYADRVPASAAWIRFHPPTDFAALFGGSTLPEYRKRGLYSALLKVRAREARARGYRFLTVDASEMSRPILEKHGFVKITTARAYKYRVTAE